MPGRRGVPIWCACQWTAPHLPGKPPINGSQVSLSGRWEASRSPAPLPPTKSSKGGRRQPWHPNERVTSGRWRYWGPQGWCLSGTWCHDPSRAEDKSGNSRVEPKGATPMFQAFLVFWVFRLPPLLVFDSLTVFFSKGAPNYRLCLSRPSYGLVELYF